MTEVIRGLTRDELAEKVFNKSLVAGAVTTVLVKRLFKARKESNQKQRGGE